MDVHHVETRADGGDHDASNLLTLCGAHHRAAHEGTLIITVNDTQEALFRHADGTPYGSLPSATSSLLHARAFQALRRLGFREGDVRGALSSTMSDLPPDVPLEPLLRRCLQRLTERACQRAS